MASIVSSTTTTTYESAYSRPPLPKTPPPSRFLRKPSASASTPNLNLTYASQANLKLPPVPPLPRKSSFAALTTATLNTIPDVTDAHAHESIVNNRPKSRARKSTLDMAPTTPGKPTGDDVSVGDPVDVPGNMYGVVRFVGSVQGKKGVFAGVELDPDFPGRGKNSGDVDGISYFATSVPGAGIFVPVSKILPRGTPIPAMPVTPSTSGLRAGFSNSTGYTPPTPGLPKFSMSVGPGARAPSPQGKRQARTSLPRPDSPVRRTQMTPGPRPSIATPAAKASSRYGSPTNNRFAQSVRGTAGDPSKKAPQLDRRTSVGPRSASALGAAHGFDEEPTNRGTAQRTKTNGSVGSVSSFASKARPLSRANTSSRDEEMETLREKLQDKERQLSEQSATLIEMEGSLTELQTLMETAEGPEPRDTSMDDKDSGQLRQLLREKNEKIAMLTSEFDAHRADFRSTIDALEMASSETERVYEKRIEELIAEVRELESRNLDVDSVATQLRQLEELVQELEEGLEDARRGEAEARGEVEFLRGEVERTRTELRRERENPSEHRHDNSNRGQPSKELEQKEDEIRGLKAIIHSLSRDSVPGEPRNSGHQRPGSWIPNEMVENKIARDNLERQVAELQSILNQKSNREEELERELERARNIAADAHARRSSLRDSRDTVVLTRTQGNRSSDILHKRRASHDAIAESDAQSSATENSTLWCEICETSGHDILSCTNMFGPDGGKASIEAAADKENRSTLRPMNGDDDAHPAPLTPVKSKSPLATPTVKIMPNPMESGPVAGKESGIMDPEKWCAVCERDGHDSVDCPFEDAF